MGSVPDREDRDEIAIGYEVGDLVAAISAAGREDGVDDATERGRAVLKCRRSRVVHEVGMYQLVEVGHAGGEPGEPAADDGVVCTVLSGHGEYS
jgi:hypothetical protein